MGCSTSMFAYRRACVHICGLLILRFHFVFVQANREPEGPVDQAKAAQDAKVYMHDTVKLIRYVHVHNIVFHLCILSN